jgi:GNAT superfamily N-acetyltransferase
VSELVIRPVIDNDAEGLFALIGACFAEYDGVHLEPEGLDRDLHSYATNIAAADGEAFAVDRDGALVALVSYAPLMGARFQLKRIYLSNQLRGSGMGLKLLCYVESRARDRGATEMELWSDTRFGRAHRFYEREGYVRQDETRDLGDISNTTEFQFIKQL